MNEINNAVSKKLESFVLFLRANKVVTNNLSFSLSELERIENFYIQYLKKEVDVTIDIFEFDEYIKAYFGSCLIHHVGGEWMLNKDENDIAFNTPIIVNWGADENNMRISPLMMINGIKRNYKNAMREALEYTINKDEIVDDWLSEMKNLKKKK